MSQSIGPKHNFINPETGRIARIVLISATSKMKIHALPEKKIALGFLFPTFKQGLAYIVECYKLRMIPSMIRLQDEYETDLAFHLKPKQSKLIDLMEAPIKSYLKKLVLIKVSMAMKSAR